jgi:putative membrane protein insertion efficiency factor
VFLNELVYWWKKERTVFPRDYPNEPRLRDLPLKLTNLPRALVLGLMRLYQAVVSPALPPDTCRFYPSCSHYGYQAVYKYGAIKGSWMALKRVLRCNPFNPGGYDPVP